MSADFYGFWAIEVKRNNNLGSDDVKAFLAFKEEYPEAQCCFVVMNAQKGDSFRGFPIFSSEKFLRSIQSSLPLF